MRNLRDPPLGKVDVAAATAMHADDFAVLDGDVPAPALIDLADVRVLDLDALAALVRPQRRPKPHEGRLLLRAASPHLQTMLTLTGLHRVFPDADLSAGPED